MILHEQVDNLRCTLNNNKRLNKLCEDISKVATFMGNFISKLLKSKLNPRL